MNHNDHVLAHIYTSIFDRFHDPARRDMSFDEFADLCRTYFPDARDSDIEMTFHTIDTNVSGMIELPEFLRVARRLFAAFDRSETDGST